MKTAYFVYDTPEELIHDLQDAGFVLQNYNSQCELPETDVFGTILPEANGQLLLNIYGEWQTPLAMQAYAVPTPATPSTMLVTPQPSEADMTTTVVTVTESWQLVHSGSCTVQVPQELEDSGSITALATEPQYTKVFVHAGTEPPVDQFAYKEFTRSLEYFGTESIYLRSHRGEIIVKVTPLI